MAVRSGGEEFGPGFLGLSCLVVQVQDELARGLLQKKGSKKLYKES